ncbi:MAG: FAD-binding oxidoreductase [Gemmataceae bacterium]|nr:FAD-binding oxidoreductase [Gemmataceae bacterium]
MSLASLPQVEPPSIDVAALRAALREAISGEVRFERLDRALYSTDASVFQIVPLGVVIPKTPDDVIATLKTCSELRVPITARGGGTSQAGQSIGPGVILDFSKYLNRILEVNAGEKWVRVEPGCVLDDLNLHVKPHGLLFAPDISTANRATIGGMVANNSSGTHSVILGKTIDHVLELKVLLADGSVIDAGPLDDAEWDAKCAQQDCEGAGYRVVGRLASEHAAEIERRFPKILRRVGGYNLDAFLPSPGGRGEKCNLANLFVGSEGTLGIVLEAKLRLVELPRAKSLVVVQFADLLDALAATPMILTHGPSAVEVMDRFILDCTKLNAEAARLRDFIVGDPGAILIIEFYGNDSEELLPRVEALEGALRALNGEWRFHRAIDAATQARIWKLRTLALGLSMAEKGDAKAISFVEDTAVAPEHLRDYIDEFLQLIARHGTKAGVYAHASVGCLHVRPIVNLKTVEGVQRFQAIAEEVAGLVLKYGGALSGEHGDGLVRSPFQEKMYGPTLYQAFREIKRTFDPHNLLNPGKIVDAAPLATNLRYGPAYFTPDVPTTFDFSADGGITRTTELCAGVGECRKKRGGTMCPSFQATGDELHSTRGRANTLRLALTGQLPAFLPSPPGRGAVGESAGLIDPAVLEALDLCLECKACKSECPTNVDMARLKAEVLDQHHKKHGLPWRNWLFGNVAALSSWGCTLAPMSNWIAQSGVGRWLNEKAFGIDRRRMPPRFAGTPFWRSSEADWHVGHDRNASASVLFFPDTFVNFHEPEIGTAALKLLQQSSAVFGPPSIVMKPGRWRCCGRPLISNGMLDAAIVNATHNTEWLYHWGGPIIACEPSCILTIKDDYPALLRGELREKAKAVAERCFTFEEFLEKRLAESNVAFRPGPKRILVQGHCHQRSLVGMGPTLKLLKRIPGAEVIDLDAGCCGMAGSFGYEKEHYEISRLVGEQRLFPAIRAADPETVIVAPGFSCRLQIEHFTGRKALHPATLLQSLLD